MIFREMSEKIETAPRVAAKESKKRKDQHEDSDEALADGEEDPSRKARKVPIGDVLAAPAEPDAPRDIPTANEVISRAEWAVPR